MMSATAKKRFPAAKSSQGSGKAGRFSLTPRTIANAERDPDHVVEVVLRRSAGKDEVRGDQQKADAEEDRVGAESGDGGAADHG